ncbi:AAA family ATPase, partial [Candidatus Dependentiae bacterium]
EKSFYYERKENGKIFTNLDGCRRVLYNLPWVLNRISDGETIYLVEGEKDVHTLLDNALTGTTTINSLEWSEDYTRTLQDADVVILYDYDKTGFKRKDLLCKNLYRRAKRLRIVDLGLEYREKHGPDITDWLKKGNTKDQLETLVDQAPDYVPEKPNDPETKSGNLRSVSVDELLTMELPEREMLLSPIIPSQGLVLLVAKRGVGKTHIALGIAYAVSIGETFLLWDAPRPRRVLYIDGEMPAVLMQQRLNMIISMYDKKPTQQDFRIITPDLQEKTMPDLSLKEGRDQIEKIIEDYDLVVIDNISCLFRSGSENEAESWQQVQEWILDLRRRGKSVLLVHHAGKSGSQRGTSKREDILDTVILLKQPEDYKAEEGARFGIHFDKARHFSGEDARSFQVRLIEENGVWGWEISDDPTEELISKIADLKKHGFTLQAIQEKTGLTKSQVETRIKKAKERNLL